MMSKSCDRQGGTTGNQSRDQASNAVLNGRVYHSTPSKVHSRVVKSRASGLQVNKATTSRVFDTSLSSIHTDGTARPFIQDLNPPEQLSTQLEMLSQALRNSKKSEDEMGLIYKQQHELQLLMAELRDRDKELNETVSAHQKQLDAWDADRRKILTLEERYSKCKKDLYSKDNYINHLEAKVRTLEEREHSHSQELETTQVELQQAHIETDHASKEFQKLKSHQQALQKSIRILKEREDCLNKDLQEKNSEISEKTDVSFKLERTCTELEGKLQVSAKAEELLKQELEAQREIISDLRQGQEKLHTQKDLHVEEITSLKEELAQTRERCAYLERELQLAGETDQRKEQLLSLQRTKQQRSDTELSSIRQLYDRQQRELELLRLNLSSTQEQMIKQEEELSLHRHSSTTPTPEKSPEFHKKSQGLPNNYSRVSTGSASRLRESPVFGDQRSLHPLVSTADMQQELGQLATGLRDKLASIFQTDSPALQIDVNEGKHDFDDTSSVISFAELPCVSRSDLNSDLNSSSQLQKLLTESENLAREMNASQRFQAHASAT
ncbi:coiled-coil domain-containing protein 62-like [Corticium candelabrum]|uniref:coiled-coil domain-containing protein 62-like n=1 Tax=Corticium candelabrum TaxID=121492 RepID=UPI002E2677F5|nr:coiled-coil domain-containing protein 62-like [Corticium candelabrum]